MLAHGGNGIAANEPSASVKKPFVVEVNGGAIADSDDASSFSGEEEDTEASSTANSTPMEVDVEVDVDEEAEVEAPPVDRAALAELKKSEANEAYKQGEYAQALALYGEAIGKK